MLFRRTLGVSCFSWVLAVSAFAQASDSADGVPVVDEAATRAMYDQEAASALRMLKSAYELTPAEIAMVEAEAARLVGEQVKFDIVIRKAAVDSRQALERELAKRGPDAVITQEEMARLLSPLTEAGERQPFSLQNVQAFIESKLPADRAKSGRKRMETVGLDEAWKEYDEKNSAILKGAMDQAQYRNDLNEHRQADGGISPAGNPMPKAEFVPPAPPPPPPSAVRVQPAVVTPPPPPKARPVVPEVPRQEPAARVEPPTPPPPPLQPAPPVDEWDRHVDAVAQKYKFTSDQKSKGQGILKDLRDRARQYRKSHSADFEAASRMQPGADRVAEEKRLSQPLDELFAELKERLEHLPTQEQRDAAGVKPKK